MDYKKRLRRANQKMRRKAQEDRDVRMYHSASYHRFFEDYTEYKEVNDKGRKILKRVYTGTWYVQELEAKYYVLLRLFYILLFAGTVSLFGFAGMVQQESGSAVYVVLPEIVTVGFLFYLLYTLFIGYLFVPKKMTIHDYRSSSQSLKKASLGISICLLCDAGFTALYFMVHPGAASAGSGYAPPAFLAAAVLAGAMYVTERRIPYREVENEASANQEGIVIEGE